MSNSLRPHGLQPTRFLCPWDSPVKNSGVGSHSLLWGIFPTQGLNLCLLQCKQILYPLSHQNKIHTALWVYSVSFVVVHWLSGVPLFVMPWTVADQASLFLTVSWRLLKLIFIESMMPSNHLILCCPPLLLPSILPSIRVFSNESALLIRWPKYWNFSFSISPSSEYSGLISFRMDWCDLLAVRGTLKSLL